MKNNDARKDISTSCDSNGCGDPNNQKHPLNLQQKAVLLEGQQEMKQVAYYNNKVNYPAVICKNEHIYDENNKLVFPNYRNKILYIYQNIKKYKYYEKYMNHFNDRQQYDEQTYQIERSLFDFYKQDKDNQLNQLQPKDLILQFFQIFKDNKQNFAKIVPNYNILFDQRNCTFDINFKSLQDQKLAIQPISNFINCQLTEQNQFINLFAFNLISYITGIDLIYFSIITGDQQQLYKCMYGNERKLLHKLIYLTALVCTYQINNQKQEKIRKQLECFLKICTLSTMKPNDISDSKIESMIQQLQQEQNFIINSYNSVFCLKFLQYKYDKYILKSDNNKRVINKGCDYCRLAAVTTLISYDQFINQEDEFEFFEIYQEHILPDNVECQ